MDMSLRIRVSSVLIVGIIAEAVVVGVSTQAVLPVVIALAVGIITLAINAGLMGMWFHEPLARVADKLTRGQIADINTYGMLPELQNLVSSAKTAVDQGKEKLGEVLGAADRVKVLAGELVSGTHESSRGAENQRREADAVATTISEMAETMHLVTGNASSAAEAAREANREALEGQQVVNSVTDAIHSLASEVERAASAMQTLEADTESIGAILEVIRGIADQTNLLALNAAIEAARAGEQGRGFAVVADEVRTLAQRTQQATQEIHEMIARLQSGSSNAVKVMDEGRRQAELSVGQANRAGSSLGTITHAVDSICRMNEEIADAIKRQTSAADTVNNRLGRIVQLADEAGQRTQQRIKMADELGVAVRELNQAAGS